MAQIKSALELALEKTKDVKSDPKTVEAHEHRNVGKRLASRLQEESDFDLKRELKRYSGEQRRWVEEGFFQVVLAAISLPSGEEELGRLTVLRDGLAVVLGNTRDVHYLFQQVHGLLTQYLDNRTQLIESLRNQYSQRMRQRQEELSRQYGGRVQMDPSSDPEFGKALQENLGRLQEQYQGVLDQAREQLKQMFDERHRR
ncbi:MAG: DUF6657 family protein [Spirochaetaceae bacterium]